MKSKNYRLGIIQSRTDWKYFSTIQEFDDLEDAELVYADFLKNKENFTNKKEIKLENEDFHKETLLLVNKNSEIINQQIIHFQGNTNTDRIVGNFNGKEMVYDVFKKNGVIHKNILRKESDKII